jgi:hypothetical protein
MYIPLQFKKKPQTTMDKRAQEEKSTVVSNSKMNDPKRTPSITQALSIEDKREFVKSQSLIYQNRTSFELATPAFFQ